MPKSNINDIQVFLAVARERSFTRAAARLGVSPSAISHALRLLEEDLGSRLIARTTRSVSVTEAGERLLRSVELHVEGIDAALEAFKELGNKPVGTVRINSTEHAATSILWPAIERLIPRYPGITFEVIVDNAMIDIVAERFDAGIRLRESLDNDIVAVRISPEMQMVVVGSPSYFRRHGVPKAPQELASHTCINFRLPTHGGYLIWDFEKDGKPYKLRPTGTLAFNHAGLARAAALAGAGLAYLMEDFVAKDIEQKRLVSVLNDWSPPFSGYYLYYPSRRQISPALSVLVEALRYREC